MTSVSRPEPVRGSPRTRCAGEGAGRTAPAGLHGIRHFLHDEDVSRRLWLWASLVLVLVAWPGRASAQSWVSDVQVGLSTGLEGSDTGIGPQWQRARGRLVVGFDLGNSETGYEAYGARAFVELERTVAVGAELGYVRWFTPSLNFFFGGVAVIAPETLFGGTVAATYCLPMGERFGIPIWASISALPLGSDRGNDGVVVWTLLGVGVRGRL
jgi:hypothetical protein